MQTPLQITWRHMDASEALAERIHAESARLETLYDRITSCHVTVDQPHKHQKTGQHYRVGIELHLPGEVIVVGRDPNQHDNFADAYAAVNEAFSEAGRRLQDAVQRLRRNVKRHEDAPRAKVARIDRDAGFGFLETADGREIYFHRNAVLHGGFDRLEPGQLVHFAEEAGEKGPQASTVRA